MVPENYWSNRATNSMSPLQFHLCLISLPIKLFHQMQTSSGSTRLPLRLTQAFLSPLVLTAVASTITEASAIISAVLQHKVQWRNARSYTKVNSFILCLKYVSLRLCKAAHGHSCVGLKERLLINERESQRREKLSLPQFSFKHTASCGTPLFGLRHHG